MSEAIIRADRLGRVVGNAQALVSEAKLHLEADALECAAVDPANVAMCSEELSADAFESYEFDGGVIGVSLDRLDDILGMAGSDDLVHLALDENTRTLHIEVDGLAYTMGLIDPDSIRSEPELPNVEDQLTATVVLEARALKRAGNAADLCSDHVAVGASVADEVCYAEAEGDTDDMRIEWGREDTRDGTQIEDDARSLFSLDYVNDILGPLTASQEVRLRIGAEVPLFLDTEFADDHGALRYTLAPRLRTDGGLR